MANRELFSAPHSKPQISCLAPLEPDVVEPNQRIIPWASLSYRYKAQPQPPHRSDVTTKTKQAKSKKGKKTKSKVKTRSSNGASSTSTNDPSVYGSDHISALPQYCLLRIFNYLSASDLLRVGLVCRMWNQLSIDKSLWKNVSLEGTQVKDYPKAVKIFQARGTIALDFYNNTMMEFTRSVYMRDIYSIIKRLPQLQYLHFGHASTSVISQVPQCLPDLRVLQVHWLEGMFSKRPNVTFDLGKLSKLSQLRVLKIRSINSLALPHMSFSDGLASLGKLQHLQKLSLTSLDENRICPLDYEFLTRLPELRELELGDCGNWRTEVYKILGKLTRLRSLRLENGGCWCKGDSLANGLYICTCNISETLSKLKELEKLELIMYRMPSDINPALTSLLKLSSLTFWPTASLRGYTQGPCPTVCSAGLIQTNSEKCRTLANLHSLRTLIWGVPIITYNVPEKFYPYNVTTEKAVKSDKVKALTEMLGKQFPNTAVNVLIVPVVIVKDRQCFCSGSFDSSSSSESWTESDSSESDYEWEW
ncbi:uncharacterized protein [Asterias amurensis]|uniref:uncharacterized protein n=1 Tax=Asterias amurensis TaxID=7602 RepID=UPI003AB7FF55